MIRQNEEEKFDFISVNTCHGKYLLLNEVLLMLKPGGIYIIDDMLPQCYWSEVYAVNLVSDLGKRTDLLLTKQSWAVRVFIIAVEQEPLSFVV